MPWFGKLKRKLIRAGVSPEEEARIQQAFRHLNSAGFDDWGLDPETLKASLATLRWFYEKYFRVETVGIENLPKGRVLLIANHGGQLPIDGMLVAMSLVLEGKPARIARGMVERWFPVIPFISTLFMRCGQVVGDQR